MTKLGKLCIAIVLALVLAPSALAGITDYPPAPAPESPAATAMGITETPPSATDATAPGASTDLVIDITLDLLQSVLF